MDEKTMYKETFSCVKSGAEIHIEDFSGHRRGKFGRKLLLIAAAICVIAALGMTAYAADFIGLRSFILRQPPAAEEPVAPAGEDTLPEPSVPEEPVSEWDGATLSLQGYTDSPESLAMAEWLEFKSSYDADGSILEAVGNDPTGLEDKYDLYTAYDQTMADKLDEIAEKYNLRLHTAYYDMPSEECPTYTDGEFLNENHRRYWGYIYEDGSFHYDGDYFAPGLSIISYQLERHVTGSFSDVCLSIGDPAKYEEWQYDSNGTVVLLALSENKSLVMADLGETFVFVNILSGTNSGLARSDIEVFADSISWDNLGEIYNLQKLEGN